MMSFVGAHAEGVDQKVNPHAIPPMTREEIAALPCVKNKICVIAFANTKDFLPQIWKANPRDLVLLGSGISDSDRRENLAIACVDSTHPCRQFQFVNFVSQEEAYFIGARFEMTSKITIEEAVQQLSKIGRRERDAMLAQNGWNWSSKPIHSKGGAFQWMMAYLLGQDFNSGHPRSLIFWKVSALRDLPVPDRESYESYRFFEKSLNYMSQAPFRNYFGSYQVVMCGTDAVYPYSKLRRVFISPRTDSMEANLIEEDREGKQSKFILEMRYGGEYDQSEIDYYENNHSLSSPSSLQWRMVSTKNEITFIELGALSYRPDSQITYDRATLSGLGKPGIWVQLQPPRSSLCLKKIP